MFDFNAFAPPLSNTATLITFQASSDNPAGYQVHFQGTGLSYNHVTGVMGGTISKVLIWDATANAVVQTMNVAAPVPLLTRINAFLDFSADFADTAASWFGNQPLKIGAENVVFSGTSATIPVLDAADNLLGYIKAIGSNLSDANFETTGRITQIIHEDAAHQAVLGDVLSYDSSGASTSFLSYGMLKLSNGVSGNDELFNEPLTAGSDTFIATGRFGSIDGGAGNDTYVMGSFNNFVVDSSGIDLVTSTVSRNLSSVFFRGVENLTLLGTASTGTGSAGNNTITGNGSANTLSGQAGNDVLKGLGGVDTLKGDGGNDTLIGGSGRDFMTGGANADRFTFNSVSDMGKTAATRDVIKDFTHGTDKIDLSPIDANGSSLGDPAFKFLAVKGAAFTGVKGQLHWFQLNSPNNALDKTIVEGDINGDRVADFQIELTSLKLLTISDFGL